MAEYRYIAIDGAGKQKKGNIIADSESQAIEKLKYQELYPISMKEASLLTREIDITIGKAASTRDLSVFCRQFASMLAAGVTILASLDMLIQQTENKAMVKAFREVQQDIMKGETLSSAMRKHNKVFPELIINMVIAGEMAGKLDITFNRLADQFEKTAKTEGMIKKASIYPIIVSIVALAVTLLMLIKIVPSFMKTFESMDMDMPAITIAVVNASNFVVKYWYAILAVVVGGIAALKWYKTTDDGKMISGRIKISIPLFGKLNVKTISSLTARTMSTLIYSGMTLVDSINIVAKTSGNAVYKKALQKVAEDVRQGVLFSTAVSRTGLYPPMFSHMIGIGEETGDLENMLEKLADYYDEEVEQTTQTVMAALEPMIILVMALLVMILVAAVMAPMIAMYSNLGSL